MSEKIEKVNKKLLNVCKGPFGTYKEYEGQKDFDKYYIDVTEKEVFKPTGEKDPDTGEALGVIEKKLLLKKIDIAELIESQRDSVGVESYMRALTLQGDSIDNYHTLIDQEKVQDYSNMPDDLASVMTAGDKAKEAFSNLDPALKGSHTTLEGFLNDLTQEKIDAYISGRIEALTPQVEKKGE